MIRDIGYPCINRSVGCISSSVFRLKNYSEKRLIETCSSNLNCLKNILLYNIGHKILFFRLSSDIIPFASHPICKFNWQEYFKKEFKEIGSLIKNNNLRISMHPDQFVVLNSKDKNVVNNSIRELKYHADLLDHLSLNKKAKIQIHLGGVYGEKEKSMKRFVAVYKNLDLRIRNRLVIENDDRSYTASDCISISKEIHIPVLFDFFHHQLNNAGENLLNAFLKASKTWKISDGLPMADYSSQAKNEKPGKHAESINIRAFKKLIFETEEIDFDLMLEIKDKEKSALKALKYLNKERKQL